MLLYLLSQQFLKALQNKKVINNLKFSTVILLQKLLVPQSTPNHQPTKVQVFKLLFHKNYL